MKQLLLLLVLSGFAYSSSAQVVSNCQTTFTDTVKYVKNIKTSSLATQETNNVNDGGDYGYSGYGQKFEAPDTISLKGFCFYGYMNSVEADTVTASLYKVDGAGAPSVLVETVDAPIAYLPNYSGNLYSDQLKVCVEFSSTHEIEGYYMLGVQNLSATDFVVVTNTDGDALVGQDSLAYSYYSGVSDATFDDWYWINVHPWYDFAGWDFDIIMEPIVEYTVNSELTFSDDTICQNDMLIVMDTIVSFDDSLLYHKMYNPNYASYSGYTINDSPVYDYGNGNSDTIGAQAYTANGNYTISGVDSLFASFWTDSSIEVSCSGSVNVYGAYLGTDTTMCMQSTMVLYPGDFDTYSWNTGQTTDSITVGPILNSGVITYTVDVTSVSCNSSASITVTFDDCTGVEEEMSHAVSVYPNPVNTSLTINTDFYGEYELIMYDNQGKIVMSKKMSGTQQQLDVSDLEQGVYIVSISDKKQVVRKKLQILR